MDDDHVIFGQKLPRRCSHPNSNPIFSGYTDTLFVIMEQNEIFFFRSTDLLDFYFLFSCAVRAL